jgi:class 3 adenylate cyclase
VSTTGTATVLFTDIVGSTELRARLGEDGADALRRTHDALLAGAIEQHRGQLVKGLGDGVMATFGSASDGVDAAVAIQQAIHRHNSTNPEGRLSLRVGISTGDVVWEDDDCFGGAVIEASRMCAAAEGGQVLAADVVRLLARQGGQAFRPVGELLLKGLSDPVPATEVLWTPLEVPLDTRPPVPSLLDTGARLGFSGRNDELEALTLAWKKAASGERQAVLVTGEPGIGKTRLSREIALAAHDQGAVVLYGRCEEDLGAPYQPFVEALDFFLTKSPPDALQPQLGRYPAELSRLCPVLEQLVPGLDPPLKSDAETERYRLFEAIASWLCQVSESSGAVLVLDDLHWATRPTLVLLQHVLHATPQAKLLIVGTYRDTDVDRKHPLFGLLADLRRQAGVSRLALTGLDGEGVRELVAHAAGHELDENGRQLAEVVQRETEGNPFFVGEILRHLRESGTIFVREDRWVSDLTAQELGIPEGIREVVGRRLDRLSENANTALTTAAVVGRDFDLTVVSAASELDEEVAETGLDEAVRARLIEEIGVGEYRFSHALVRSTLYDELRATKRARTHARVATAVEQHRPADVAALAHHLVQAGSAGDVDKAVHYLLAAGEEAMDQLAHDRAVDYYAQALELLEGVPDRAAERCSVSVCLGLAQRESGAGEYRQTLLDAAAVAQQHGLDEQLVRAALANSRGFWSMAGEIDTERMAVIEAALVAVGDQDSADRARLLAVLASELMFSADDERRYRLSEEALALARRVGDAEALVDVLLLAVPTNYVPWRLDYLTAVSNELVERATALGEPVRLAKANLWGWIGRMIAGNFDDEARERFALAERISEELGQPTLRWLVTCWDAFRLQMLGDLVGAEQQLNAGFELGQRTAQPDAYTWYAGMLWLFVRERGELSSLTELVEAELERNPGLPAWSVVLGMAYIEAGRLDDARALVNRLVDDDGLHFPTDVMWVCCVVGLLDLAETLGMNEVAGRLYDELLPYRDQSTHGGICYLGSAERYLGLGARATGRLDEAVAHGEAAVARERSMGAVPWLGLAAAELVVSLRRRGGDGDLAHAEELAREVQQIADQTGSVYIHQRLARSSAP